MSKSILYFHGFASSSNSNKAKDLKKYISRNYKNAEIIIPDLNNNFKCAVSQIHELINSAKYPIVFMGSSLGGYYASYFSTKLKTKSVLINPAIPPLKDFEMYLGENKNYSTGEKFKITQEDIRYIRKISYKKFSNAENTYVLLESGDEVLNYKETAKYFSGAYLDVIYGGSHSYESLDEKLKSIVNFIEIQ
tara:strand:- start:1084 stop:1659 length:576 start_codon:yes stop_codon:yes gene_type:complete